MIRLDQKRTSAAVMDAAEIDRLADRVRGPVMTAADARFETERAGYQTARSHRPDVVVGAVSPADVRAAVAFARGHGLPVAVQGTGHASSAVAAHEGVLINTSRFSGVRVNADVGTAWVAAGTRWQQVIDEAAPAGLAPLSGSAPHVGAVSYTLGGGLGLLSRRYGYAADHVRSLDVVTADGRLRQVIAESEPDLFWALRGGRDNFGIVTGMEIDLVRVATLYGGGLFFPGESAAEVLDTYVQWAATMPDAMTSSAALIAFPDAPVLPPPLRGRHVVHLRIAYTARVPAEILAAGERLVAPLRALNPLIDTLGELPYTAAGSIHNDPTDPGAFEAGTAMLTRLAPGAVRAILEVAGPHAPVPHVVELRHLGGRLSHPPAAGNAIGHRDAQFLLTVVSRLERADLPTIRTAHERLLQAIDPWTSGGRLLNFMNGEQGAKQVRSAYESDHYQRLTQIKATYDPDNTFRLNHNIPPAAPGSTTPDIAVVVAAAR
jgi:FAD/FMN-containing dehydrogenase